MARARIYYFAYGSNLSEKQMLRRCPHSVFIAKGKIKNHKFEITGYSRRWKGGGATITPQPGVDVWGAVYELDQDCLLRLDGFEGIKHKLYTRKTVVCHFANGKTKRVTTYVREPRRLSHSSARYRRTILQGARSFALPHSYILALRETLK